ncbi:MAG: MerR family transcriptional regulator [Tidjanibacter sp.]|nr:MerR family transcriptional regulator [Tidjanibacter sp.]
MEEIVHPKGKIYYSVGEVCELFGVNASLLRFWEEEFPVLKIKKDSRGHRKYTPKDVDNLRLIYHLVKEQGMTLEGARKRMRNNPEGVSHDAEIVERLKNIRNMLAALKAEMGIDTEVIEIEEDADVEVEPVVTSPAPVAPAPIEVEEVVAEPAVEVEATEPTPTAKPAEKLAEFQLEPQPQPSAEESHKKTPRGAKVGTLIGGNLFSPEDIRLAVAKKNSKEAKSQVIEQTLF